MPSQPVWLNQGEQDREYVSNLVFYAQSTSK